MQLKKRVKPYLLNTVYCTSSNKSLSPIIINSHSKEFLQRYACGKGVARIATEQKYKVPTQLKNKRVSN